jgi:hypothetical protein
MITVELDIFCGQENKKWDLTDAEATDFIDTLFADLTVVRPMLSIPAVLGPKGHIIHLTGTHATLLGLLGVPTTFRITDLPLDLSYLDIPLGPIARGDGEAVTDSGNEESPDEPSAQARSLALATGTCSLAYTSWNDFSFWNGARQSDNNCYCYGANYATNTWSRPGRKGGSPLPGSTAYSDRPTATRFTNAMTVDGWKTTCNGSSLRVVGLVGKITHDSTYAPEWDYHFYRKNLKDGTTTRWCHKPGSGTATNNDYSGNYITAVSIADRSKYFPPTPSFPIGVTLNYDEIIGTFYTPAGVRSLVIE